MKTCAACGREITTRPASNHVVSLARVWTHYSAWANLTHAAVPR